jgi:hypothetical protein
LAAWAGLWRGWMGVPTGESLGVDVADIMDGDEGQRRGKGRGDVGCWVVKWAGPNWDASQY